MRKLFQILMILSMSLYLNSCYYDAFPDEDLTPSPEEVSYQNDIVPLWVQCAGCHNGNTPPNLSESSYNSLLDGYVVPSNAEASILYQSLLGTNGVSLMPPSGEWPASKISLVRDWIDQGAKDN
jgi:hypothetical protein